MLIGYTADRYKKLPISAILNIMKWTGVLFSEVTVNVFHRPRMALRAARGMELGLHLPNVGNFGYDLASSDRTDEIASVLRQLEKYKNMFRFRYAVFHPPEETSSRTSVDFLEQNLRKADVPLVLENIQALDFDRIIDLYERLYKNLEGRIGGMCLDIPHIYLHGEDWVECYRAMKSEVKVVHLSDCAGGKDEHLPFGVGGDLYLMEILEVLKDEGFDGVLNFEIKPPSLGKMGAFFDTYIQARDFLQPEGMRKVRRRMNMIGFLGRCPGIFLR